MLFFFKLVLLGGVVADYPHVHNEAHRNATVLRAILAGTDESCQSRKLVPGLYTGNPRLEAYLASLQGRLKAREVAEALRFAVLANTSDYNANKSLEIVGRFVPKRTSTNFQMRLAADTRSVATLRWFALNGMRPDPKGDRICANLRPGSKDVCGLLDCTACDVHRVIQKKIRLELGKAELFVDDYLVKAAANVERILSPERFTVASRVIDGRSSSDQRQFGMYGTAVKEDKFRMWLKDSKKGTMVLESPDGKRPWTVRRRWEFGEVSSAVTVSQSRNGSYIATYPCLKSADVDDPCAPYFSVCMAQSPDGERQWRQLNNGHPVINATTKMPFNADTQNQLIFVNGAFQLHTRIPFANERSWRDIRGLGILRSTSKDCSDNDILAWNECMLRGPWVTARAWKLDLEGIDEPLVRHIYALGTTDYGGLYLGLLHVLNKQKDTSPARDLDSDTMDTFLITSRDAEHWDLGWIYAREPLIPRTSWYSNTAMAASTIITHDDSHFIYFEGSRNHHDDRHATVASIGLLQLPKDRLSGLTPTSPYSGGVVHTRPLLLPPGATTLLVNLGGDPSNATLRVSIIKPFCDGSYLLSGCPIISGFVSDVHPQPDVLELPVQWLNGQNLSDLRASIPTGGAIAFQFQLVGSAVLYAFTVA